MLPGSRNLDPVFLISDSKSKAPELLTYFLIATPKFALKYQVSRRLRLHLVSGISTVHMLFFPHTDPT